jgi:UDP-glucose 4-epimerase
MRDPAARAVVVTGASGFLGEAVCRHLLAAGYAVRGLSRRPPAGSSAIEWSQWPGAGPPDALEQILAGAWGVVHLAARAHVMRETLADALGAYRAANVELTRRVLAVARAAGVGRVLFASSVKAVGERFERPITESQEPSPEGPYGRSKLEAEAAVAAAAADGALWAPVLRFPVIYGPGVRANMRALFGLVARGVPLPFGAIRNRRSFLYVENAASAVVAALEHQGEGSAPFFVSDDHDFSTPELITAIGRALGRRPRLVKVPLGILRAAALAGDALAPLVAVPWTSDVLSRVADSLAVDPGRFRRVTAWTPPIAAEAGLETTALWYLGRDAGPPR